MCRPAKPDARQSRLVGYHLTWLFKIVQSHPLAVVVPAKVATQNVRRAAKVSRPIGWRIPAFAGMTSLICCRQRKSER